MRPVDANGSYPHGPRRRGVGPPTRSFSDHPPRLRSARRVRSKLAAALRLVLANDPPASLACGPLTPTVRTRTVHGGAGWGHLLARSRIIRLACGRLVAFAPNWPPPSGSFWRMILLPRSHAA